MVSTYESSRVELVLGGQEVTVEQTSRFPREGRSELVVPRRPAGEIRATRPCPAMGRVRSKLQAQRSAGRSPNGPQALGPSCRLANGKTETESSLSFTLGPRIDGSETTPTPVVRR